MPTIPKITITKIRTTARPKNKTAVPCREGLATLDMNRRADNARQRAIIPDAATLMSKDNPDHFSHFFIHLMKGKSFDS
jgi:hypothetical protein